MESREEMEAMKLKGQLIVESDSGETEVVQEVAKLERHSLRQENLGLMLSEAKELLHEVQKAMVTHDTTRQDQSSARPPTIFQETQKLAASNAFVTR
jgi:hypothetical protein